MTMANYKGLTYIYVANKRVSNIVTSHRSKAFDDFNYEDGMYYKKAMPDELSDIFDVSYWISYDTGINGLPNEWEVGSGQQDIKDNSVLIRFSNGTIPNWMVEEKNVSVKYISKNEISRAWIEITYKRKNGITLDVPVKEVKDVGVDELIQTQIEHRRVNL